MSLIVAKMEGDRIILLSETKVTFKGKKSNPYIDGCLKVYRISSKVALGFVGTVEHFEVALPELSKEACSATIIKKAKKYIEDGMDFDLIVAEIGCNTLKVLKSGEVENCKVAYLGDKEAFEEYQRYFLGDGGNIPNSSEGRMCLRIAMCPEPTSEDDVYFRMLNSFQRTINTNKLSSVGGVVTPLCSHKGSFSFMHYADVISDPFSKSGAINSGGAIDFGSAKYGSFSFEFGSTFGFGGKEEDIGVYFLQGGFGLVFPASKSGLRRAEVIKAKNPAFWVLNSSKFYGSGVSSGFMTPDHCAIAGEELMKAGKWEDAYFCYSLSKDSKNLESRPQVYDRFMAGLIMAMNNSGRREEALAQFKSVHESNVASPLVSQLFRHLYVVKN